MMYMDVIKCLSELTADDANFKSTLCGATANQIRLALEVMKNRDGKDNSRIVACERELRRRAK